MDKTAAIQHFGGVKKLADTLGISRQAIHAWPEAVPEKWVYTVHYLSEGALPIDPYTPREQGRAQ